MNGETSGVARDLTDLLRQVPAFEALESDNLERIAQNASREEVPRGTVLIHQGDSADTLYIVLRGRFTVLAGEVPIAEISVGEPIGELAFFTGGTRTANVVAARNSEVLRLNRETYNALQRDVPELANGILSSVAARLARTTGASPKLRPRVGQTVSVLPAGGHAMSDAFVRKLTDALHADKNWSVLSEADCPRDIQANPARRAEWLERAERAQGRLVLICTDANAAPDWFDAIADSSDAVFMVGALAEAAEGPVPVTLRDAKIIDETLPSNLNLILLRPRHEDRIEKTANWLADRPVSLHHHAALDSKADFARLSRFIRGKAVGLVLCGGGAWGTAHMGAIKALREHGYDFDMLGGTSAGAAMGASLAIGLTPDRVVDLCEDVFIKSKAMGRLTVPIHSVIDHRRLDDALVKHFGHCNVEDTPINFFSIATSLTTNDIYVMRQGPLWQAVRASTSLPGILPPLVTDDGEVLIDGGLIDNVPITVMRDLKSGPNAVFNFIANRPWRVRAKYGDLPGRVAAMGKLFKRKKKGQARFPTMFSILTRAMVVNARRLLEQTDIGTDVLLQISTLPGMNFLDWTKGRTLFEAAHKEMSEALDSLPKAENLYDDDEWFLRLKLVSRAINEAGRMTGAR